MSTQAASDFFNKLYTDANMRKNLETQMGDLEHPNEGGIERGFGERIAQVGKQHGFDFDAERAHVRHVEGSGELVQRDHRRLRAGLANCSGPVAPGQMRVYNCQKPRFWESAPI